MRSVIPLFLTLCGVLAACSALAMAARTTEAEMPATATEIARFGKLHNTTWRATEQNIRGLQGPGSLLEKGATVHLTEPPPAAAIQFGLRPVRDEVHGDLERENLEALVVELRADRDRARGERDTLRLEVEALQAQVRRDGEVMRELRAELGTHRDGRALAEAEVQRLTAELDRRPPAPTVEEQLEQVNTRTLLAAVNKRRGDLDLQPIGGQGATERARQWVLQSAPELVEDLVGSVG